MARQEVVYRMEDVHRNTLTVPTQQPVAPHPGPYLQDVSKHAP
jgi:hypothetical protein